MQTNGLKAIDFLNNIQDLRGIPHIPVAARKHLRRGVGITGLIDDIIAILPVDDLYALFQEKLETSAEFKALYDAIRSPEFQVLTYAFYFYINNHLYISPQRSINHFLYFIGHC